MDIARLQIEVDSKQARNANDNLNRLSKQSRKTERDMGSLSRQSSKTNRAFATLGRAVGLIAASFGALQIIQIADNMTLLTARIQQSTRSSDEFNEAFMGLARASREAGTSLGSAVDVFQRLSFSRDEINATVQEMVAFTGTVQKLGIVSGASTGALQAGLTQLGQGLSAGILRAEEFNSILENIPAVGQAIANEFGITVGQLRNLVLEGEVLSEDVFTAILSRSQQVNEEFAKFPLTVGRAFGQLKQDLALTIQGFNEATDSASSLAIAIQFTGKLVRSLGKVFESVFSAIKFTMSAVGQTIVTIVNTSIKAINGLINAVNRIPGVDIVNIDNLQDLQTSFERATQELGGDVISPLGEIPDIFRSQEAQQQSQVVRELTKNYQELAGGISETGSASSSSSRSIANDNERLQESFDNLGNSFESAFGRFINGTIDARSALRSFLGDLQGALLNSATAGLTGSGLLSTASGLFSGFFGASAQATGRSSLELASASAQGFFGPGFATGGSFTVGGTGGTDSQMIGFRATPGEMVNITRPSDKQGSNVTYNIDARGAQQGVEQKIEQVLRQVTKLRQDVPGIAVNTVRDENSRNPRFLRNG